MSQPCPEQQPALAAVQAGLLGVVLSGVKPERREEYYYSYRYAREA